MEPAAYTDSRNRNYDTISPSAKSLLLMKGFTNIPFARQAAELMKATEIDIPNKKDMSFWARLVHFEMRYWSIDQLLQELPVKNILELSSGFSFRGLEMVKENNIHYMDTDLPDIIAMKKNFLASLQSSALPLKGKLETLPLNALDEDQFSEIVNRFPSGEIAIVNEGLLMYLGIPEKEKLCRIIHKVLKERGGYWITADIYIKKATDKLNLKISEKERAFFEQHRIEENKFESFEDARAFFANAGFVIDKEAKPDYSKLSSIKFLWKSATLWQLFKMRRARRIQATWRLRPE